MFHLFDTIGYFIRSSLAVGFAAFWGWSSMWLKLGDLRLIGLAGVLVIVALVGAGIAAGLYTLILFLRGDGKRAAAAGKPVAEAEPVSDFDPDAIIARHIAARQTQPRHTPRFRPAVHRPLGAASGFGRKAAQA